MKLIGSTLDSRLKTFLTPSPSPDLAMTVANDSTLAMPIVWSQMVEMLSKTASITITRYVLRVLPYYKVKLLNHYMYWRPRISYNQPLLPLLSNMTGNVVKTSPAKVWYLPVSSRQRAITTTGCHTWGLCRVLLRTSSAMFHFPPLLRPEMEIAFSVLSVSNLVQL